MDAPPDTVDNYAAAEKIYPREVSGHFARLRRAAAWLLLGFFYSIPWLQWSGRQALLFDVPRRKFHIFSLTLWPQDFIYLALLLIIAALALFFFTALAGRLWCGFACPQTVWTEVYLALERFAEGNRSQRMKLDAAAWSGSKFARKAFKQFLWITFSLWTGFTFVGFFTPIRELAGEVAHGALGGWETFWILFYGAATYGNAGYLREQVCKYFCPYARFQSAMFDRNTLIITYDAQRGEPRGARKKGTDPRAVGLGDCVDCSICVQACPTGIDIRKGLQYECIACAACIDACDSVMDKIGYPKRLIRYATQNAMDGRPTRVLRPRVLVYGAILCLLLGGMAVSLALRKPLALDVLHDRNALYRLLDSGDAENVYLLKVMNKTESAQRFRVGVTGAGALRVDPETEFVQVPAGEVLSAPLRVRRKAWDITGASDIKISITSVADARLTTTTRARLHRTTLLQRMTSP
jgi:cytochrome c oxidase accessory protein FixG